MRSWYTSIRCVVLFMLGFVAAALPLHSAEAQVVTGSTAGAPTWNRPVAGNPPTPPASGVGTAVPYQAIEFTVSASGSYSFQGASTFLAGWDNYTFLYENAFDPTMQFTNVLIGNDDNPSIGLSGFTRNLTAGTTYFLVTTGFGNGDSGAYTLAVTSAAGTATFVPPPPSGQAALGTTAGKPTWNRPNGGNPPTTLSGVGTAVPFDVLSVTVSASGTYSFQLAATAPPGWDTYAFLYANSLDPALPLANVVIGDDDNPTVGLSGFTVALNAGTTYYFVATGFGNGDSGGYSVTAVSADGAATFGPAAVLACCDTTTGACTLAVGCPVGTAPVGGGVCAPSPCPFPGAPGAANCTDCWLNGAHAGLNGQASHLGGALPLGSKAADDFTLCSTFVHDLRTITATLLTTTTQGLVKPRAEIWSDCNGCPSELLFTLTDATVVETGLTEGVAFDGRPLRVVHATFDVANQPVLANRNVVLKGGNYWLSVYGVSDGLGPIMQMYDVTYWGATNGHGGGVQGKPAHKIDGLPTPNYLQFEFPPGCGPQAWHSVVDDCCIGCTDLNFTFCAPRCKVLVDNGRARPQVAVEPVGSTSRFAPASLSATETRSADDFVLPGCGDHRICYAEACVLTNCAPGFQGVFELYANDCNKPSYALHGVPLNNQQYMATKVVPLGFTAFMDGQVVAAYRLEFHDLNIVLPGSRHYWISAGVKHTFSINERAFFCYNADCARTCLIRWNAGKVLTATTLDDFAAAHGCVSAQVCNGWQTVGNDFSFLIAADNLTVPGPINATPSCPVDHNRDGALNAADIFDFLNTWFTGCP